MEPQNSKKNIGIGIGVVAFVAIFFTTIFSLKGNSQQAVLPADQSVPANTQIPSNAGAPVSAVQSGTSPQGSFSEENSESGSESDSESSSGRTNAPVPAPAPAPATIPKKTVSASVYRNGTYSATGSYMSPGGYDQLGVSVTLQNDIITAATVTNMAGDGRSSRYQNAFISGYKPYVIGQNIASVNLSRVSGASLTPQGFNDALSQIMSQAKA